MTTNIGDRMADFKVQKAKTSSQADKIQKRNQEMLEKRLAESEEGND
jgi:hypothetical protein